MGTLKGLHLCCALQEHRGSGLHFQRPLSFHTNPPAIKNCQTGQQSVTRVNHPISCKSIRRQNQTQNVFKIHASLLGRGRETDGTRYASFLPNGTCRFDLHGRSSGGGDAALAVPADLQRVTAVGKPAACSLHSATTEDLNT